MPIKGEWMQTQGRRGVRVAGVMLIACLFAACQRTPAEQQIRAAIEATATAARANDVRAELAFVSGDFVGNNGDFDRNGLRRLLVLRALQHDQTSVLVGPIKFARQGERIVARFNLILTGGHAGRWLPEGNTILKMTTAWRRDGGKWVCYNATWVGQFR